MSPICRSSLPALALGALLGGCSEYDLIGNQDDNNVEGDPVDVDPTDTDYWGEDCGLDEFPGFAAGLNEECINEIEVGTFTPVVEWRKAAWSVDPTSNQVMSTPIAVSLTDDNGDGKIDEHDVPDIVLVTYGSGSYANGGVLRAISGDGGAEIWNVVGSYLQGTGSPAAADIDGDGIVEILAVTQSTVIAFEHDGTRKWVSGDISRGMSQAEWAPAVSDAPAVGDMDGDGKPEIIVGSAIVDNTGKVLGIGAYGRGGAGTANVGVASFPADVDGDGQQEVVTGNALYRKDGSAIWYNAQPDGYPAIADFDDDGKAEIVVSGNGFIRLQDTDGTVLWTQTLPDSGGTYYGGPATIADYDGDGEPEIGVAGNSTYAVYEGDGSLLWRSPTQDASSGNTGSAVFDFEGDGVAEVVYADETRLWVFSGIDGSVKLESSEHTNGTWLEYPIIADVDGDGHAEIVVANTGSYSGITVFGDLDDSWQPGRKIWNQHAYFITNIDDDGGVPAHPPLNWSLYNNFRSGALTSGEGLVAPDLNLAEGPRCEVDCDEGRLVLYVYPGNEGASAVIGGSATVDLAARIGGSLVALEELTVADDLEPGAYLDAIRLEIEGLSWPEVEALVLEIGSNSKECDEDDNVLVIDGPFCE